MNTAAITLKAMSTTPAEEFGNIEYCNEYCKYCLCKKCINFDECEPCRGDYDYEHPCPGECDEYESEAGGK